LRTLLLVDPLPLHRKIDPVREIPTCNRDLALSFERDLADLCVSLRCQLRHFYVAIEGRKGRPRGLHLKS